jgi:hypothetical protein
MHLLINLAFLYKLFGRHWDRNVEKFLRQVVVLIVADSIPTQNYVFRAIYSRKRLFLLVKEGFNIFPLFVRNVIKVIFTNLKIISILILFLHEIKPRAFGC